MSEAKDSQMMKQALRLQAYKTAIANLEYAFEYVVFARQEEEIDWEDWRELDTIWGELKNLVDRMKSKVE